MPAVSAAQRVAGADLLDSDSLPLDRAGDSVARRTTVADLKTAAGLSAALRAKLDNIEANATADQTGAEIVALLEALAGSARLDAAAIDGFAAAVESATDGDLTGIALAGRTLTIARRGQNDIDIQLPAGGAAQAQTGPEIVALLTALQGAARLPYAALRDTPDDPADTWAQQFTILSQTDGASSRDLVAGGRAAGEIIVPFDAAAVADEAALGITRATGRTAFANLHADADTTLRATGKIHAFLTGTPAGQLKAIWREYDAGNNLLRATTLADHGVAAAAAKLILDLPLGSATVRARRGRTYDLVLRFEPAANVGARAAFGVEADADDANLMAFQRFAADPAAAGVTEAQLLAETNARAAADTALGRRVDVETTAREAADTALGARIDALPAPGGGAALRGLPAKVPAPLRDDDAYIRVTSDPDGSATHSYDATANIPGITRFVDSLAAPPARQHERVRLNGPWGGHAPGDYEGVANPVELNEVAGTLASRDVTWQDAARKQYGWDTVAPGTFGAVSLGREFCPEFYWWDPQADGRWVLNAWLPNATANTRASIYIEVHSSETSAAIGQGLNRTAGRLGNTHRQYQSSAVLTPAEIAGLTEIHDAAGDNDVRLQFFESPDGVARGAALNFQPAFVWQAVQSQAHLRPFVAVPRGDRVLRGDQILADWGREPVFASAADATAAGVLDQPGLVYALLPDRATRPQRFFVRRGYAGSDGAKGAVSGRNKIRIRLNPFANGLGYWWAMPYRAGHFELFDNVEDESAIAPGNPFGVVTLAGSAGGQNPLVQLGVRDPGGDHRVAWPVADFWVILSNRETPDGRTAGQFTLNLARNTAAGQTTARYGGVDYNLYSFRFNDALTGDMGNHGQWILRDEAVEMEFYRTNGGNPIDFNPDEVQFTRGAGYRVPTDAIAPAAVALPGPLARTTLPIAIAPFHPSDSQAAAADHTAFEHVVTAEQAGDDTELAARFTITTTGANSSNRMVCDMRLERVAHADGSVSVLDRSSHYVRHSSPTEFTLASFSISGTTDLRAGDTVRIVSRSFDQFADSDLMIQTTADHAVNALTLARR